MNFKDLVEKYVPNYEDVAETSAGELLKAVFLIWKRYDAIGDMICGYNGGVCVNKAARFIKEIYPGTEMAKAVEALWGLENEKAYCAGVESLKEVTVKYITEHPELAGRENEWDLMDFDGPEDKEEDEDEEEQSGVSQREMDLAEYPPRDWRR